MDGADAMSERMCHFACYDALVLMAPQLRSRGPRKGAPFPLG
jgi:hypothetical protein